MTKIAIFIFEVLIAHLEKSKYQKFSKTACFGHEVIFHIYDTYVSDGLTFWYN
jgi:hypothetical protein